MTTLLTKTSANGLCIIEVTIDDQRDLHVRIDGELHHAQRRAAVYMVGAALGRAETRAAGVPDGSRVLGRVVITPDDLRTIESRWPLTPREQYDRLERERWAIALKVPFIPTDMPEDPHKQREFFERREAAIDAGVAATAERHEWEQAHPDHMVEVERRQQEALDRAAAN